MAAVTRSEMCKEFEKSAESLYEFCAYPAVRRRLLQLQNREVPEALHAAFRESDIFLELYDAQDAEGGWGRLKGKDYAAKDVFPTSLVALERCRYIGVTMDDRDVLIRAQEYLEAFLHGTSRERFRPTNEREIPWNRAIFCTALEAIEHGNPLCDRTYGEWLFIANRAFEDGGYSYDREAAAQHELFATREERLVPIQFSLLLKRRENVSAALEAAMLRQYGGHAYEHGHFWAECPAHLPADFVGKKTRRWFHSFHYINQFNGSALFLENTMDWLMANRRADGLWDYGPQIKDPWGYFGYYSRTRQYAHNRIVDCTMEVLSLLAAYLRRNTES